MPSPLFPFLLFAFVASITPGPTNLLVLSNSARYGLRAVVPIILGACTGAAAIVLVVGLGLGESLAHLPNVRLAMQWVGVTWLSYLAWKIFSSPVHAIERDAPHKRLGLLGAAGLQLVNPKTWMMALAVVSVFADQGAERQAQVLALSLVFFVVSLPCLGLWALLGAGSTRLLGSDNAMQRFNQMTGALLLISTWMGAFHSV
ncbi:LysE family translocator [Pseudomonas sp. S35]|uniref:LysE family translocator n=1 Tax=Pseudomonas sp. S35 TaxID=1573719 RepID=UPI00157716AC|nr:LysE family translocator [Pseudomonas sp. S35]